MLPVKYANELFGQQQHILDPVAQWRKFERHNVQPVIQVSAQSALSDGALKLTIGGGQNPHIDRNLPSASKPRNLLIFENAKQFGLHLRPHLCDLVEQKGSAVRAFETAFAPAIRAGEGAALVAEQFAFDQGLRNGRAIDGDVGTAMARRFVVDCTCGQLLSRTTLASDDHRRARGSGFFDQAYGPAYR